jgi:hypothetical protein
MPVIPILLSDSSRVVDYKVQLAGQVSAIQDEIDDLILRRRYVAGDHDLLLNADQKAFLDNVISESGRHPVDNKVQVVVNKLRRRINVQGFAAPGEQASEEQTAAAVDVTPTTAQQWAQKWWSDNKMDSAERELYHHALVDGYGFVSVEPKSGADGNPVFHIQKRWDGESGVRFFWEQDSINRNPSYAVKYWYTRDPLNLDANNLKRVTLYTKNAIYKWIQLTNPQKQAPYFEFLGDKVDDDTGYYEIRDSAEESYPIEWVDKAGEPLGLAVVPFVAPMGNVVDGVIGLQDALNKTWLDIIALADQQGFGQIVLQYKDRLPPNPNQSMTGGGSTSTTTSDDGIGFRPGRVLETTATPHKLPADNIEGLHKTVNLIVTAIASNTEQPLYHFVPLSGEVPSGAALDELSKPVAEQAEECAVAFSPAWSEVMLLAQKISATFGGGYRGEAVMLTPKFKPQPLSPESSANQFLPMVQLANAIVALSAVTGSVEGAARFLGCSEQQIQLLADTNLLPPPAQ